MTGAELPLETKNILSHRGKAMRALIDRLREASLHGH
jgi:inosine/xanthosine triphosphate pyrophosphatase family protein